MSLESISFTSIVSLAQANNVSARFLVIVEKRLKISRVARFWTCFITDGCIHGKEDDAQ